MRVANQIIGCLTGAVSLQWHPNSGAIVLLRAVWSSLVLYACAVTWKCLLITGYGPKVDWLLVRTELGSTVHWAGAILAGTYGAFYARFASQWGYLAEVSNQLMMAQAQAPDDGLDARHRVYVAWQAAIVEQSHILHLAGVPMFAPLVAQLLEDPEVVGAFLGSAVNAEAALTRLERVLSKSLGKPVSANRVACAEVRQQHRMTVSG